MPPKCATCSAPFGEHDRVCHYCGTSRGVAESVSEEKAALEELHAAMAKAMHEADARGELASFVRDRFLQNGPIPSAPELLMAEAVRCQQFFLDEVAPQNAGPEARYRACLLRLQLLSIDEPALKPKVDVLRQNLETVRRSARRGNLELVALLLAGIGVAVLLGAYLVRALAGFFLR